MHKNLVVTLAAIASLATPAHAAKFSCVFYGGIPPTPACTIDSGGGARCEHTFPGNVTGTCLGRGNAIACIFHNEPLPADAEADIVTSSQASFLARPGFLAGAVAEHSTKWLLVGYRESRTGPERDARCTAN